MNLANGLARQQVPCSSVGRASYWQIGTGWGLNPHGGL